MVLTSENITTEGQMRKLVTTTFVTLDGVMQAPGGPEEDASGKFEFGGWQAPFSDDDDAGAFIGDAMSKPFDLLLGRKTYDIFASYWPRQEGPIAKPLNEATKYVASRAGVELTWDTSHLIEGDVIEGIKAIKNTEGPDLLTFGSGNLIQSLLDADVIDEMQIITYPLTIGTGKKLFADGTAPTTFKPVKTAVSSNGVFMAIYQPAGGVEVGTMGPE